MDLKNPFHTIEKKKKKKLYPEYISIPKWLYQFSSDCIFLGTLM